jgi:hypothetical protein
MDDTSTDTTSAATTETSPAAPATSAPSPSVAPDQRPTFEQAFAADAARQTPETQPATESPTTPAAETTETTSAVHPSTETQGPIPFTVHKTALDNARTKATQEAQATFDRDYGWAKAIPRETIQEWSGIAQLMASDPAAFMEKYFAEAVAHPTHGPGVKSWAAKTLAARVPPADTMPAPDVQIVDAQGNVTGLTYSDTQLAKRDEWRERQLMEKVGTELQPFKQEREQKQAEAREAARKQEVAASVDDVMADIAAVLEIPVDAANPLFVKVGELMDAEHLSPHKAAMRVRQEYVVPKLAGSVQTKVLEDLQTKAAAAGMNPAGAVVATTKRVSSLLDPSLSW